MTRIHASYQLSHGAGEPEALAEALAWEQTVEAVPEIVPDSVRENLIGRVESIRLTADGAHELEISYAAELAEGRLDALLNLLYGNASLYPGVSLVGAAIPADLAATLDGPQLGVAGLRELIGVYQRPLLATALKPRGATVAHLAGLAERFARGGGDLLKDDQNLAEADFEAFKRRVDACARAVERGNAAGAGHCAYFPHISGGGDELRRRAEWVRAVGLHGVLMCPLAVGLEQARAVSREFGLAWIAHPSLAGAVTRGIAPEVLYGTLYRLAGADIAIFPGHGGRLSLDDGTCTRIQAALSASLGGIRPTLPCPAGGKNLATLPDLMALHGPDTLLLVGGALQTHDPDLAVGTGVYLDAIRARYPGRTVQAQLQRPADRTQQQPRWLASDGAFRWPGVEAREYERESDAGGDGVRRFELLGGNGERMSFELRYFELDPGASTALEMHLHTHVVIGVRGRGELRIGEETQPLETHDIAYVPPAATHQLHNPGEQAFGFYCMVDRVRDRPLPGSDTT